MNKILLIFSLLFLMAPAKACAPRTAGQLFHNPYLESELISLIEEVANSNQCERLIEIQISGSGERRTIAISTSSVFFSTYGFRGACEIYNKLVLVYTLFEEDDISSVVNTRLLSDAERFPVLLEMKGLQIEDDTPPYMRVFELTLPDSVKLEYTVHGTLERVYPQ